MHIAGSSAAVAAALCVSVAIAVSVYTPACAPIADATIPSPSAKLLARRLILSCPSEFEVQVRVGRAGTPAASWNKAFAAMLAGRNGISFEAINNRYQVEWETDGRLLVSYPAEMIPEANLVSSDAELVLHETR